MASAIGPNYSLNDISSLKAGEILTAGKVLAFDSSAVDFILSTVSTAAFGSFLTIQTPIGISLESAADGERLDVMTTPGKIVRVTCGGTVTAGSPVRVTTGGKVVDATLTTAQMTMVVGLALEAGSSDTEAAIIFQPKLMFKET